MSNTKDGEWIVTVTEKGQATIPKSLREKHGISAPGRVKFVESEDGEIVVRPVGSMREFRGLDRSDDEERSATELLRSERERDERESDELVARLTATAEDERAESGENEGKKRGDSESGGRDGGGRGRDERGDGRCGGDERDDDRRSRDGRGDGRRGSDGKGGGPDR